WRDVLFSSRRRHTIFSRDWSSDVCSSDLALRTACEMAEGPYAIASIPLLAEGGGRAAYPWLRRILVVDVPEAVQLARLLLRDGEIGRASCRESVQVREAAGRVGHATAAVR